MLINLKTEMTRHRKTNADMAKYLGVSDNTFSFKLNGKREFTLDELKKIAQLFSVSIDYLAEVI
jgi:transcriptional regulator with XRE-family HTH domain